MQSTLYVSSQAVSKTPHAFVCSRELGEAMTDEELKGMIDEFDLDGDGES